MVHGLFMQIVLQLISGGLRIKIFCHVEVFMCKLMQSIASSVYFLWSFCLKYVIQWNLHLFLLKKTNWNYKMKVHGKKC
jgi:hypothetical protein